MPLSVSTLCPSCGGEIEFDHGSNAVRCSFCGSSHLVTGRGRVLSYYLPEKINARLASATVQVQLNQRNNGAKVKDVSLFFVPFYYLIGQEALWTVSEDIIVDGDKFNEETRTSSSQGISVKFFTVTEKKYEFTTKHFSLTVPATATPELGMNSLGFRPEVLKLMLYESSAVAKRGSVAPVTVTPEQAAEAGYAYKDVKDVLARKVFGKIVSIIFFPFWVVETDSDGTGKIGPVVVMDAVSGALTNEKAPLSLLEKLVQKHDVVPATIGFRPLKCPNCGSGLPARANDIVFFCANCRQAWQVSGDDFLSTKFETMPLKPGDLTVPEYMPFWMIEAVANVGDRTITNKFELASIMPPAVFPPKEEAKAVPLRFFWPAFTLGSINALARIAASFTSVQPVWRPEPENAAPVVGCYHSPEDALYLTPFILASIVPRLSKLGLKNALAAEVKQIQATLVLVPFKKGRFEYIDCIIGRTIPFAAMRD